MKYLLVGIILLTLSVAIYAEPSKRESVEELLELCNAASMTESIYSQLDETFKIAGQQLGAKESEQELVDNFMTKLAASMKTEMTWEKMKEPMIDIYQKHYSEEEVQELMVFYRTETGQSLLRKTPQVLSESALLTQKIIMEFMPKVKELTDEFRSEVKAHRAKE